MVKHRHVLTMFLWVSEINHVYNITFYLSVNTIYVKISRFSGVYQVLKLYTYKDSHLC